MLFASDKRWSGDPPPYVPILVMTPFPLNHIYQLTHWPLQRNKPGITITEVNCSLHLKHMKDNAEHIQAGVCIYFTGVSSILICTNNIYRTTTTE